MEALTKKQIQDRSYYAANAERIKAKKREQYALTEKKKSKVKAAIPKRQDEIKAVSAVKQVAQKIIEQSAEKSLTNRTLSIRERIENRKIEKELMGSDDW